MITNPQILARDAAALLVVFLVGAFWGQGIEFAKGTGLAGGLIIANLWGWTRVVGTLLQPHNPNAAQWAMLAYGVKMLVLMGGLVLLTLHFPPLSVLTGASVVVGAVLLTAARAIIAQPKMGEA